MSLDIFLKTLKNYGEIIKNYKKEDITLLCGDAFGDSNIFFLQFAVDTNKEDLKGGLDLSIIEENENYNDVLFFCKENIKSFRFRN